MTDATTPEPRTAADRFREHLTAMYEGGSLNYAQRSRLQGLGDAIEAQARPADSSEDHSEEHWHRGPSQSCSICKFATHPRPADPAREFARWWLQQPKHIQHAFMRENGYVEARPAVASEGLRAALEAAEWYYNDDGTEAFCIVCDGERPTHDSECIVFRALASDAGSVGALDDATALRPQYDETVVLPAPEPRAVPAALDAARCACGHLNATCTLGGVGEPLPHQAAAYDAERQGESE